MATGGSVDTVDILDDTGMDLEHAQGMPAIADGVRIPAAFNEHHGGY